MDVSLQHLRDQYESLCRFCLSQQECVPIFTGDCELNDRLSKVLDVLLAKVDESDGLPNNVCVECVRCIERFVDFETACAKSYELLAEARKIDLVGCSAEDHRLESNEVEDEASNEPPSGEEDFEMDVPEDPETDTDKEPVIEQLEEEQITIFEEETIHLEETAGNVLGEEEADEPIESTSYSLSEEQQKMLDSALKVESHGFIVRSGRKIPLIVCLYCKNEYRGRNTLKKHLRIHLNIKDYLCKHCPRTFTDRSSLRIHQSHHGDRSFQCVHCNKSYFSQNELRQHVTMQHLERKYTCETCQQKFPSKSILNDHLLVHLSDRPFVCKNCGTGFKRNRNLQRHQVKCEISRVINCMVCAEPLRSPSMLLEHLKSQHSKDFESLRNNRNSCQECDVGELADLETYLQHLQSHWRNEGVYSCGECSKSFKTRIAASKHMKVHNGDGNYSCEINDCRTFYRFEAHLKKHVSETH